MRSRVWSYTERQERNRNAPLEMQQGHPPAAPAAEFVAEERPPPAEHERAVRGEIRARDPALAAHQHAGGAQREQHMTGAGEPQVGDAAVLPAALEHRLEVQVASHREALAPALEPELHEVDPGAAEGGVRTEAAVRGRRYHRERADRLPSRGHPPLAPHADAVAVGDAPAVREVVVPVVAAEFLGRELVEERREDVDASDA